MHTHGIRPEDVIGDALEFTGFDLASAKRSASTPQPGMPYDLSDEQRQAEELASREYHDSLVQSAKTKLRHASDQGKTHATMSQEEADALAAWQESQPIRLARMPSNAKLERANTVGGLRVRKTRDQHGDRVFSSPVTTAAKPRKPLSPTSANAQGPLRQKSVRILSPYSAFSYEKSIPGAFEPDMRSMSADRSTTRLAQSASYTPRSYSRPDLRSVSAPRVAFDRHQQRVRAASSLATLHASAQPEATVTGRRNTSGPADFSYVATRRAQRSPDLEPIASPINETMPDLPPLVRPGHTLRNVSGRRAVSDGVPLYEDDEYEDFLDDEADGGSMPFVRRVPVAGELRGRRSRD